MVSIKGYVEGVRLDALVGWAVDEDSPDTRMTVFALLGNTEIGRAVANVMRPDLVSSPLFDGRHGFFIEPVVELSDADLERVAIFVVTVDNKTEPLARWVPRAAPSRASPETEIEFQPLPPPAEPLAPVSLSERPLFLLGAARSGTSAAIGAILASGTRYRGCHEGHVFDLLFFLTETINRFYDRKFMEMPDLKSNIALRSVPRENVIDGLLQTIATNVSRVFKSEYWIDKTPDANMIRIAPMLIRAWPNARFIFMRRRAFENIASRERKFRGVEFDLRCDHWASAMRTWLRVRPDLRGKALEVDQQLLAHAPDKAARIIGAFLEFTDDEVKALETALIRNLPERTQPDHGAIIDPTTLPWDAERWANFDRICRPLMVEFGYSFDEKYFESDQPHNLWRLI